VDSLRRANRGTNGVPTAEREPRDQVDLFHTISRWCRCSTP